jgi:hypothetical protein
MMLIGLQEWIMTKTPNKTLNTTKPMRTMRTTIKMKMKTLTTNTIESTRKNSKIYYRTKENKPIPTNIEKLKVKEMKPSERKKAQTALMFLTEKRDNL